MIRRPPRSTRTDTLFPYTTLFRSVPLKPEHRHHVQNMLTHLRLHFVIAGKGNRPLVFGVAQVIAIALRKADQPASYLSNGSRSVERRVGKECVSTCRSRWSPYH